jgi:hypothetical protein
MASPELQDSWRKTTEFLRDARSHLSEAAEGICADEIAQFEDYLSHNELELALDSLEAAVCNSPGESLRVFELLISAAENMGLEKHAARYRTTVASVRDSMEVKWKKRDAPP